MIKFFRNIRRRLLGEGKTGKYLTYAIGEILLVVIGILIALQVNNWNEERKDRKDEKQVAQTIYEELEQNLEYNNAILEQLNIRISMATTLMDYTADPTRSISSKAFDSIMVRAFLFPAYTPVKADLDRVLGSEQIDLIQSKGLQEKLSDYKTGIDAAMLTYNYAEDDFKLIILPYFVENYPLKSLMLQYGIPVPVSGHNRNHEELLKSMRFENILSVIFADTGGQLRAITENVSNINELKTLIEEEFPSLVTE